MVILQIEHQVPNFEAWKKAFENDPVDRKKAGVRRYRILQQADNPDYVIIELEFELMNEAERMLVNLQNLWKRVDGKIVISPKTRILNQVESKAL
jgi:hypothetical protein